ncbi:MAG: T9SS type A sorting domain-containing protein [Bacteroidetes bacterium]|nr:T9SS type A sorting domain-containing protein [Bacteroidota bacterium]
MKKQYYLLLLFLFVLNIFYAQNINPIWKFVGPKAENEIPSNRFRSGQIDDITVEPGNPNHIIASSFFAGIWETNNYNPNIPSADWHILPGFDNYLPDGMGANGVSAVAFRNTNELYAANFFEAGGNNFYSNAVLKYDFNTTQWFTTGILPFYNSKDVVINKIVFFPNNLNTIFLCTSSGLVESTNAGVSWFQAPASSPITGNIHDILFIQKSNGTDYFWYVAGCTVATKDLIGGSMGNALLMESTDDGANFYNVSLPYMNQMSSQFNSYAGICLGDQTLSGGDRDIYISTAVNLSDPSVPDPAQNSSWPCYPNCPPADPWEYAQRQFHKLTKNITSGLITNPYQTIIPNTDNDYYYNSPARLVIGYDATTKHVLTGGVDLHDFNLTTNNPIFIGSIHDDYHGIYINTSISPNQIFFACDGGFASLSFLSPLYSVKRLNNGLDISLLNGFSGASELHPITHGNIYVYGQQDEPISDLYDDYTGKVIQHGAGENDGALIDKFNNNLIITDASGFNAGYYLTTGGSAGFTSSSYKYMYNPASTPNRYLQPGTPMLQDKNLQGFGRHPFFQDPFRPGRIYNTLKGNGISQYDPISKSFVLKVNLSEYVSFFTNSAPNYTSSNFGTVNTNDIHFIGWQAQPLGMSFSQIDKNIMYIVSSNNSGDAPKFASQVIKYIGSNLDEGCWGDGYGNGYYLSNNTDLSTGNPQWQLITPAWSNLVPGIQPADIYHIGLTNVETSNWDKNKIYVSCALDIPNSSMITPVYNKVIKYDGTSWSDYSGTNIPSDENVTAMIMDHASNDGIYISTEKGVYYREPGMSDWVSYNMGVPNKVLPFIRSTQMEINYRENTVRAGTYGRGIWKSDLVCPSTSNLVIPSGTVSGYKEADDISTTNGNVNTTPTASTGSTVFRGTNSVTLEPGFTADATTGTNYFTAFIHGCSGGSTSSYNYFRTNSDSSQTSAIKNTDINIQDKKLIVYPNPTAAKFSFRILGDEPNQVLIYNSFGQIILNQLIESEQKEIDFTHQPEGIYFIKVLSADNTYTTKIIKR